jgi:PKD repeat protein
MKLKHIIIVLIYTMSFSLIAESSFSQCYGGGTYQSDLTLLADYQTTTVNSGERYGFQGNASITYIFTFCQGGGNNTADTQIEICDASGATVYEFNDDHCGLGSEITWVCPTTGNYSIVVYEYDCQASGAALGTLAYRVVTPPTEQDCLGAIPLCGPSYSNSVSYSGDGNYPAEIAVGGSCPGNCMDGEQNDVWYTFTAQEDGYIEFMISPLGPDDYDWAVFDLTHHSCADILTNQSIMISCNSYYGPDAPTYDTGLDGSGDECGGPGTSGHWMNDYIYAYEGQTFVLNVSNWSGTFNGYSVTFGGSADIVDTEGPELDEVLYQPECGASSITVQFDERIWCTSAQPEDFVISGPNGNYDIADVWSEICEAGLGSTYGDTYYDDIWTLELNDYLQHDGDYTISVNTGGVDDICANPSPGNSLSFTITGIDASTSSGDVTCNGSTDGWAEVTGITGAALPYSTYWEGPSGYTASTDYIDNLEPGIYYVTVSDVTGRCEFVDALAVQEPPELTFSTSVTQPACGGTNGSIFVHSISGSYSPFDIHCIGQTGADDVTSHLFDNLGDGSYEITVTDDQGCTGAQTIVLNAPGNPDATFTYNGNQCFNNQSYDFTHTGTVEPGETYNWTFSNGSPASSTSENPTGITFNSAGVHNVNLTVTAGTCTDSYNLNITVLDIPDPNISVTDENCGNCDGVATAVSGFVNYTWSSSANATYEETGLCAGNYTLIVEDLNGCTNTEPFTIGSTGDIPVANVVTTPPTCAGDCDATATVNASGPGTFSYSYSSGSTPNNQSTGDLCAGSYDVTVADGSNPSCNVVVPFTISDPTGMTLTMSGTDSDCGLSNGSASVSVTNGTGPYTYDWSNGGTSNSITSISAGNYTVTVFDANGCSATNNIIISDAGVPFTVTTSVDQDVQCNGDCDGAATATVSGGTGPFSYQWSSGTNPTNFAVTGLCVGTHTVTVTEGSCIVTETVTITQPTAITGTVSSTDAHCGLSDGSITVSPSGGTVATDYSYEWDCVPAQYTATANNLASGTYHVTVEDDNGCTAEFSGSIMNVGGVAINETHTATQCSYSSDASATVNVLSGDPDFTYAWSHGTTLTTSATSHTQNSLPTGAYSVTVTDTHGCSAVTNFNINAAPVLNASIAFSSDVSCDGLCDGTATGSAFGGSGGYSYDWGAGNGNTPNQASNTGLCPGNYMLTVTDGNACTAIAPVTIDEPAAISLSTSVTNANCGLSNGSATVTAFGGTVAGDYTYSWSGGAAPTSATNTGLSSTGSPYTVTVEDDNGCSATASVTIIDDLDASVTISNIEDITCNGETDGTATVSIGGGTAPFLIEWGTTPIQNSAQATNLSAGTYYVTVTDGHGCTYEAGATIHEPTPMNISITAPNIDCFGVCNGSALANASGGTAPYSYMWSDFQSTIMANHLCAGDYHVTVTDDNLCTATQSVTITENSQIVLSADISNSDCGQSNGAIDLTISGGAAGTMLIDWDYGPHTEDLVNIPAGSYTVTVTDSKGCQAIQTFAVSDLSGPTLNISSTSDVGCFGDCNGQATVQVIGGTGPFDYHWDTSPVQTNPTATNLCAGTYMITVTDMTTGCISISSATINEPDQLDVSSVFTNPECHNACNGQIQLTTFNGTAPYSYNWVGPGTLPATEDLTNLCDGTYTVVITDNNGCMITRNFTLIEPSFITAPTTVVSANCSGTCDGEAIVNPSGGNPPYTYEWSDINSQTSQTAYNLCPGIYGVTVTDDNGCTTNNTANIPSPSALSFGTVVKSDPICYGSANGSINVSVNGGTPPYSYSWDSGSSNALADNLLGGTHCVTVSDGNGCFIDTCILINEPPQLNIAFDISNETCNGLCDGEIEAIASGGTPTYEYIWSNGSINPVNDNLCAGLYLVTITDQNGCQFSSSASISGASVLDIVVQDTVMPHCGNTDGSITVGVIGGTSPYLYNWSNPPGGSTSSISGIPNGNYTVTVTDANSCTAMKTIDLNDEDGPIIDSIVVSNIDCYGNSSGEAIVYFTSITSTNSIEWNDPLGQTSAHAINLSEGNYTVTITDDNGCQASETISITEPNPLSASISSFADASCFGNCNGSATASFSGGTPPVMYSWSSGQNTASVGGLCPGTYSVTITDSSGCTAEDDVEISEPTEMVITENIFPVTCHGGSDGSITVSVSGGTGNYDYEWFGTSGNDPVVTGLSSASYTLVVYNANDHSCFTSENYFVPQPSEINAIFNTVDATCNQDNGGAYVLTTFGGTPGYNYSWTPGNFTNTDSIGNLAPGSYECLVSDAYGCTASFSVNVGETPAPVLDNVLTSPTTCFGYHDGTAQINVSSGTPPYTYNWRPNVSSTNFCDTLPANLYTVTITDQNGCHVYATVPISSPEPVVTILNPADSICIGQTAQVGATASGGTAPYSFLWENLGYGSNHYVTPELTTDYTVIAEDINGCLSSPQTVQILVQPPLDLTVITPNSVCLGESAILSATAQGGDGNYVFNWGDGTVTNNPQIVVAPAEDTDYTIVLTDGCGSPADTADVTVRVAPQPIINITRTPNNGCSPISIQFDNNTNNYTYSYLWNFDDDESGENNFSEIKRPVHYYENPGYYEVSLTVTTDQGCIDSGTINIQVKEAPIADFNAHPWTAGMMESNIHFNDESIGATAWLWHFGNDAMSTIQNPNHVFSESGEIPVKLIAYNNIGCTDTVVKYVNIIEDHRFYMPTAINVRSPGNDEFYPKGVGIDLNTYQMSVYNRWGEPIFITNDINEHWLGRYDQNKGEYVQQGVYTWVVTLTDKHGKEYTYSGRVMVFK